ncbi:hypothetical protein BGZ76_000880 [Entomortierella beljakovae]|nr:hypothetical protein BGZ76_000880 [Entomortierella beljakovae]
MDSIQVPPPSQTSQESLLMLANISLDQKSSIQPGFQHQPSQSSQQQELQEYDYFLGLEMNPYNVLFTQTVMYAFVAQFFLFYGARFLFPSLVRNRRGTAWILSFCCSTFMHLVILGEMGQIRFTLFEMLGLDSRTLGLPDESSVFSYWMPSLYNWVQHAHTGIAGAGIPGATTPGLDQFSQMVLPSLGHALNWFTSLPIFSLAPLKPPVVINPNMPYYLGGGGRLFISLENLPRSTAVNSLVSGWFVAYAVADLILGRIYCPELVDPLSGYVHHTVYSWTVFNMGRHGCMSYFGIIGGAAESGGATILTLALILHSFWFRKFISNVLRDRKKKKTKKTAPEKLHEL